MKKLLLFAALCLWASPELAAQENKNSFDLEPQQVMLMTGKGPGQDGALNPYYGQDCLAIVQNTGSAEFTVRIEEWGKIINMIPVAGGERKLINLLAKQQLLIDGNNDEAISVELNFEPKRE